MHNRLYNHIKNLLLPCLAFSVITGFLSAIFITFFKMLVEKVIELSSTFYAFVRENPIWIPLLVLGATLIGVISSFILSHSRSCRGGGIPTSVTAIRGIVSFKWIASLIILPFSALLTFMCGIPLGTEGPCVQMGTAVGDGVVKCIGNKKQKGWRRYIMTGGASAGFSIATASPISAIIFSMEELHKHFSPLLLTVASLSVISAQSTLQILSMFGINSVGLFRITAVNAISQKLLFIPLIVGIVCGLCSIIFTRLYHFIDKLIHKLLKKLSIKVVFPILFALVSIVGIFISDTLGTGHDLTEHLLKTRIIWYVLIIVFLLRMVFMMIANTSGVTGGVFLPTLAFGAAIGSLCAEGMIALGLITHEHYLLIVILGITSFLGATSRIPVTACVFAVEALGGINNILSVIIATTFALLTVEISGLEDFTDTIIESKMRSISKGKKPAVVEAPLTVKEDSFVVGKELRDILWPNACKIVSFERADENHESVGISAGDIITVRYETYDPSTTAQEIEVLVGDQSEDIDELMHPAIEALDMIKF